MRELGRAVRGPTSVYFTGGATAVLERHGAASFFHFDIHAQALSKVERGHDQDVADVAAMLERGLIKPDTMWLYHDLVAPALFRYPALDPPSLLRAMESAFGPKPAT